jgi:hypothetical protein
LHVIAFDARNEAVAADFMAGYGIAYMVYNADITGYLEFYDSVGEYSYYSGEDFFTFQVDFQRELRVVSITLSDYSNGARPVEQDVVEQQALEVAHAALALEIDIDAQVGTPAGEQPGATPEVGSAETQPNSLAAAIDFPAYKGLSGTEAHAESVTAARDALDSLAQELGCTDIEDRPFGNDGLSDWSVRCRIAGSEAFLYIIRDFDYHAYLNLRCSSGCLPRSDYIRVGTFLATPTSPEARDAIRTGLSRVMG